jgi:O-antigen/teichoic acid export membrane protein
MLAQLRRNLVLLYGAEMLGKVLGLVVFGYLGRTLLAARYGDLEFALGILFLLNLVIDAGLGHYGAREAAIALGFVTDAEFDAWVVPEAMVGPSPRS